MHAIDKSSLQSWLSSELEQYGIDSKLYARHILDLFLNSGYTTDLMLNKRERNIFSLISDYPKKSSKLKRKAESRSNSFPCTYDEAVWKKQMALERLLAAADEDVAASNINNIKDLIEKLHNLIKTLSDARVADDTGMKKKPKENYNDAFPSLACIPMKEIDVCNTAWNKYKINKIEQDERGGGGYKRLTSSSDFSTSATKGKDFNANNLKCHVVKRVTSSQMSQNRLSNRERRHPYVKKKQSLAASHHHRHQHHQRKNNRKQTNNKGSSSNENEFGRNISSTPPLNLVRHRLPLFEKISQNNRLNTNDSGRNSSGRHHYYDDNDVTCNQKGFSDKICSKLGISQRNNGSAGLKGRRKHYFDGDASAGCNNLAEDLSLYRNVENHHKRLPLFRRFCRRNNDKQHRGLKIVEEDDNKYAYDGFKQPEDEFWEQGQATTSNHSFPISFKREKFVYPNYKQQNTGAKSSDPSNDSRQQSIWNHYYLPVSMSSDFMTEVPKSSKWFRDPETGFLKFIPASHLPDNDVKVGAHTHGDRVEIWKYCPSPNLWRDELDGACNGGGRASRLETIYSNPSAEALAQDELIKREWERYQAIFTDIGSSAPGPNAIGAGDCKVKNAHHQQVFFCRREDRENIFNPYTDDCNNYILSLADNHAMLNRQSRYMEEQDDVDGTTMSSSDSVVNVDTWLQDVTGKCYEKMLCDYHHPDAMFYNYKDEVNSTNICSRNDVTGGVFGSVIHKSRETSQLDHFQRRQYHYMEPLHYLPPPNYQDPHHQHNLFSNLPYDKMFQYDNDSSSSYQDSPSLSGRSSFWTEYDQANESAANTMDNCSQLINSIEVDTTNSSSNSSLLTTREQLTHEFRPPTNAQLMAKKCKEISSIDVDEGKYRTTDDLHDISHLQQQLLNFDYSSCSSDTLRERKNSTDLDSTDDSFDFAFENSLILDYLNEQLGEPKVTTDDQHNRQQQQQEVEGRDSSNSSSTCSLNRLPCFKQMLDEDESNSNFSSMLSQKLQHSEADILKLVIDHVLDDESSDGNDLLFPTDTFDMFYNWNMSSLMKCDGLANNWSPNSMNLSKEFGRDDYLPAAVFGIPVPAYECRSCVEKHAEHMTLNSTGCSDKAWRLCSVCADKEQSSIRDKADDENHEENFAHFFNIFNFNFLNFAASNLALGGDSDLQRDVESNGDILKELNDAIRLMSDSTENNEHNKLFEAAAAEEREALEMLYGSCNEMFLFMPSNDSKVEKSHATSSNIGDDRSRCKSCTDGLMECVNTNDAWKTRVRISNMWESVSGIRPVDILYNEKQHPGEMVTLQPSALTHFRPIPSNDSSNAEVSQAETKATVVNDEAVYMPVPATATTNSCVNTTTEETGWLDMALLKRDNQNVNVEGVQFGCAKCEPGSVENEISDLLKVNLDKQQDCSCKKKKKYDSTTTPPNPLTDDQLVELTQAAAAAGAYNRQLRRGEDKCLQTSFEQQIQLIDRNLRSELSIRPPKANSR